MYHTDTFSQHCSVIWPIWINGRVFVYEVGGCEFQSRCSHLINDISEEVKLISPKVLTKDLINCRRQMTKLFSISTSA